jgi:hypothetical protein
MLYIGGTAALLIVALVVGILIVSHKGEGPKSPSWSGPVAHRDIERPPPRDDRVPPQPVNPPPPREEKPKVPDLPPGTLRQLPRLTQAPPELKAPTLEGARVERPLPGKVTDVVAGGGGRWLLLLLGKDRRVAVFDTNSAKVEGHIDVPSDEVRIAAGMHKLIVGVPRENRVELWDIATRQRETTATLPLKDPLRGVYLGSASNGPLLVTTDEDLFARHSQVRLFDLSTFRPIALEYGGKPSLLLPQFAGLLVRASADGRTFAARESSGSEPHTLRCLVLSRDRAEAHSSKWGDTRGSLAVPGPDGSTLYLKDGLSDVRFRPLPRPQPPAWEESFLPAHQGDSFIRLEPLQRDRGGPFNHAGVGGAVSFFLPGMTKAAGKLDKVDGVYPENLNFGGNTRTKVQHDKRVHYFPAAKMLALVPPSGDRLVLYRFDIEDSLDRSGESYLVVTSLPPQVAHRGQAFDYQVRVKTDQGRAPAAAEGVPPPECRLDAGPPGMAITKSGAISWAVPADFPGDEVSVLVRVGQGGREATHKFTLHLIGG